MVTISDIAQVSGVSISTVSRVLNGNYVVSKENRENVLKAMRELGYVHKKQKTTNTKKNKRNIIIITSVMINEIIEGIQDKAEELNYELLIKFYNKADFHLEELIHNPVYANNLAGIITLNTLIEKEDLENIISENIPVIQIGQYIKLSQTYSVSIDDEQAGYETTKHLIESGKKKIAFIGISSEDDYQENNPVFSIKRLRGYVRALNEFDIPYDKNLIFNSDNSLKNASSITEKIINKGEVDGILAASDNIAIACIKTIKKANLKIPEDISVIGFDNLEISEFVSPKLTTVYQPFYEIGAESIYMLNNISTSNMLTGKKVLLDHSLIKRESTL